jgi:hypothetical protein
MNRCLLTLIILFTLIICPTQAGEVDIEEFGGEEPPTAFGTYQDYYEVVGEGHIHSVYSGTPSTVSDCAQKAYEQGLDWIFITDYNTVAAKDNCTQETNSTFITGLGEEVATGTNEVIAWGIDSLVDWNTDANYTVGDIIDDIHVQGGLAYIPHPFAPDEDDNYDYFDVYEDFDAISIYHGYGGFNDNAISTEMDGDALRKWDEYLTNGIRKTAVGESDCKDADNTPDYGDLFNMRGAIGYPRNYIYAKEFSERGIIEAVRNGRCYVTDGPTMNFTIDGFIMGETIYSDTASSLNIAISGNAVEASDVRIISNGAVIYTESVTSGPFSVSYDHLASSDAYFRAEIRTFNGDIFNGETNISFANPVYFDLDPYEEQPFPPTNLTIKLSGDDIVLNWSSSNSSDVVHYDIFKSTRLDDFDFTYPYASTSKTNWSDLGAGEGDINNYYYIVRSIDTAHYNDSNMIAAAKYTHALNKGWNMISTPLILSNTTIVDALRTINDTLIIAQYYDILDSNDPWKDTLIGDFDKINNSMAFWLYLESSDFLFTCGIVPNSTSIPLYSGWNLVGYPSFRNQSLLNTLNGVSWKAVQFYESSNISKSLWMHNNSAKPSLMNDIIEMKTGQGYWIYVTDDSTLIVYV